MSTTKVGAKPKATPKKKRVLVEKSYRLLKYSPLSFELKTGRDNNLVVFDENTEQNRAIKHCPNEKSIFVDEQSKLGVVKPIIFFNGVLNTGEREIITQDFLEIHPKRGYVFEIIDSESDAEEIIEWEETIMDLKAAVRAKAKEDNGVEELRVLVSVLISDPVKAKKFSVAELKNAIYDSIDGNPDRFIDEDTGEINIFDDSSVTRQAIAQQAFNSGVIQVTPDSSKIQWVDNKQIICLVPQGRDHVEFFAQYLESEEGLQVASEIAKRS